MEYIKNVKSRGVADVNLFGNLAFLLTLYPNNI